MLASESAPDRPSVALVAAVASGGNAVRMHEGMLLSRALQGSKRGLHGPCRSAKLQSEGLGCTAIN